MKSQQFQDIFNAVPLLASQQRNALINALSEKNPSADIAKTIREGFERALFGLQNALIVGRNPFSAGGLGIIASVFGARLAV